MTQELVLLDVKETTMAKALRLENAVKGLVVSHRQDAMGASCFVVEDVKR
jgi:hypothetical protein